MEREVYVFGKTWKILGTFFFYFMASLAAVKFHLYGCLLACLCVAALRLLRKCIGLKDEFYYRHITRLDLFRPVVEAFVANAHKYNLLNSALIELFDFIRVVSFSFRGKEQGRRTRTIAPSPYSPILSLLNVFACWKMFTLSGNFLLTIQNYGLKIPHLGEVWCQNSISEHR